MKADLHVHTNISDSSLSVEETVKRAADKGATHLGIVDHDTTAGLEAAMECGRRHNIKIVPGIEISAYSYEKMKKVHILGFCFDLAAPNINRICRPILERRTANSIKQAEILIKEGFDISVEDVLDKAKESTAVYKQHIMDVLVDKGYTDGIYSDLYMKYFKNNGACSGDIEYVNVFEAVKAIKTDGGFAILAHPGQLDSYDLIDALTAAGLDGLEACHQDHDSRDILQIMHYRQKYNFILTGGSDFHGRYGNSPDILGVEAPEEYIRYFC